MVEDEEKISAFIRNGLESRSFKVAAAETGEHDVILLNIMLPGRDGLSIPKELRASGHTVPVTRQNEERKMSGAAVGASTVAMVAVIANAIKACGTLIRVEPQEFLKIVEKQDQPLVVIKSSGVFSNSIKYLTSYKGLAFHCKSQTELRIPHHAEVINAKKFSMPEI